MIRINLLPRSSSGGRGGSILSGKIVGIGLAVLAMAEVLMLGSMYLGAQAELDDEQQKNRELSAQIERTRADVRNHQEVKQKLEQLREREAAINTLKNARSGPTAVLLEIAQMLTPGRGPTVAAEKLGKIRRENPQALFSPDWDARRLWLTKMSERERVFTFTGFARDAEDVSELARRLALSDYFEKVILRPASRKEQTIKASETANNVKLEEAGAANNRPRVGDVNLQISSNSREELQQMESTLNNILGGTKGVPTIRQTSTRAERDVKVDLIEFELEATAKY